MSTVSGFPPGKRRRRREARTIAEAAVLLTGAKVAGWEEDQDGYQHLLVPAHLEPELKFVNVPV